MTENLPPEAIFFSKWPSLLLCNGSSNTVWAYYIFFERVSVLVRMHLLYNVGQACFFEHEWGLLLALCAYGVYRVRVVVLGACQVTEIRKVGVVFGSKRPKKREFTKIIITSRLFNFMSSYSHTILTKWFPSVWDTFCWRNNISVGYPTSLW